MKTLTHMLFCFARKGWVRRQPHTPQSEYNTSHVTSPSNLNLMRERIYPAKEREFIDCKTQSITENQYSISNSKTPMIKQQRGRQRLLLLLLRRRRLPTALQHSFDTLKGKDPSSLSISLKRKHAEQCRRKNSNGMKSNTRWAATASLLHWWKLIAACARR